ncbi:unnamed protein product, partial [Musa acuminata subsp. burmannicoides]
ETFSDEEEIRSHVIAVNIQLSYESENEAEELQENLNCYFQNIYTSNEEVEMPYPQKPQKELIAAGLEEDLVMEYPQLAKLSHQVYSSSAISNYRPPADSTMGPVNYPPAVNIESTSQRPEYEGGSRRPRFKA